MYGNSKLFQTERRYDEPIDGIELQPSSGSRQLGSTRDVRSKGPGVVSIPWL